MLIELEVEVFHDHDEMVRKVRHYLELDEARRAIAEAGQQRALANYTNMHTFQRLFATIAERGGPVV